MLGHYVGVNAAADVEFGSDAHEAWIAGGDKIAQHLVGDLFMECTFVTERPDVHLQRFQFDAALLWYVVDIDGREVWLAGFGAEAGEFRDADADGVVAILVWVFKGFECFTWCACHGLSIGAFYCSKFSKHWLTCCKFRLSIVEGVLHLMPGVTPLIKIRSSERIK